NQQAGTLLNVQANGTGTATALNVSAPNQAAGGKAVAVTVGTAGTPIYVNTANLYSGSLVSLNVNSAAVITIDQAGKITGPASGNFVIDSGNAAAINIGGVTANAVNIGSATPPTTVLGRLGVPGHFAGARNKFNVP